MSKARTTRTFDVSLSSVKRYVGKASYGESLAPKKSPGSAAKLDEKARELLAADLKENPYATLQQRCDYIEAFTGVMVSRSTVCRAIARLGATLKKGGPIATERDEFARVMWEVSVAEVLDPESLVFVDECGIHTSLAPIYGYAPKGERLQLSVPRSRGKNTTLLSSITTEGMGPSLVVEGATTAKVFKAYVEHSLVPSFGAGQVVVMDNLGAHRPKGSGSSSRVGDASCFTYQPTPPITTP